MFNISVDGQNIGFSFKHTRNTCFQVRPGTTVSDVTECDLLVDGKEYSGIAACVAGDKFEKEVGRKIALRRALEEAGLARPARTEVWKKYFGRGVGEARRS